MVSADGKDKGSKVFPVSARHINYFTVAVIKSCDQKQLKEERDFYFMVPEGQSP